MYMKALASNQNQCDPRTKEPSSWLSKFGSGVLWAALSLPTSVAADVSLTFGTYAADKPTETVKLYKPFLNYLSEEMSILLDEPVSIKLKIAKSYDAGIQQLAAGEVDFARFGPASYITVVSQNPGVQIVAMESNKGAKRFKGVIAIHSDSEINSLNKLKSESFAFGNELSTIGRYLAQSHLLDAGVNGSDLSQFKYLGRHDVVGSAVGAKKFTAGALKKSTFKKLVEKGVPIKSLYEFDNVTKPWLAASDLDSTLVTAMKEVMLAIDKNAVAARIAKDGFLEGTDEDYDFIRQAMLHSQDFLVE